MRNRGGNRWSKYVVIRVRCDSAEKQLSSYLRLVCFPISSDRLRKSQNLLTIHKHGPTLLARVDDRFLTWHPIVACPVSTCVFVKVFTGFCWFVHCHFHCCTCRNWWVTRNGAEKGRPQVLCIKDVPSSWHLSVKHTVSFVEDTATTVADSGTVGSSETRTEKALGVRRHQTIALVRLV